MSHYKNSILSADFNEGSKLESSNKSILFADFSTIMFSNHDISVLSQIKDKLIWISKGVKNHIYWNIFSSISKNDENQCLKLNEQLSKQRWLRTAENAQRIVIWTGKTRNFVKLNLETSPFLIQFPLIHIICVEILHEKCTKDKVSNESKRFW